MTIREKSKQEPTSDLDLAGALNRALPFCEELNQLLRYLCTQGNNEEIYKAILANIFELDSSDSATYVVTENRQGKKKEGNSREKPITEFQLKAGTGKNRRSDIYIVGKKGNEERNLHVIEFKSDRHGNFFYEQKSRREKSFPDNIRRPEYAGILDDVEVLYSQKENYVGARFWICVVLYSFDCEKENYPKKYPRYWNEESRQDLRKKRPFDESAFNEDCESKRKSFVVNLSHLINKSPYRCNVKSDRIFQSEVVSGEHRGVVVRSDIVLLEVNFE